MARYTAENLVSSRTEVGQAIEELSIRDLAKYNIIPEKTFVLKPPYELNQNFIPS